MRYFQDALGIDQTGVVTPELKKQIFAESAPEYRQYVALTRGSHGIRVEALQSRLRALSYTTDPVDGDYGSRTAEAVRLFQQKAKLSQTGAASVETLKALMAKNAPTLQRIRSARRRGHRQPCQEAAGAPVQAGLLRGSARRHL